MTIFMYGKKEQVNQFKLDEDGAIFFQGLVQLLLVD